MYEIKFVFFPPANVPYVNLISRPAKEPRWEKLSFPTTLVPHGALYCLDGAHSGRWASERSWDFWQALVEGKNSYRVSFLDLCLWSLLDKLCYRFSVWKLDEVFYSYCSMSWKSGFLTTENIYSVLPPLSGRCTHWYEYGGQIGIPRSHAQHSLGLTMPTTVKGCYDKGSQSIRGLFCLNLCCLIDPGKVPFQ